MAMGLEDIGLDECEHRQVRTPHHIIMQLHGYWSDGDKSPNKEDQCCVNSSLQDSGRLLGEYRP